MQQLSHALRHRLNQQLPHHDIHEEELDPILLQFIKTTEKEATLPSTDLPARLCAVLILLYQEEDIIKIPFIERPSTSRVHPGQIAFPGGKKEEEDSDLLETAIRETKEEIGVGLEREDILGALTPIYIPPSNAMVTPFIGILDKKPIFKPEPSEVTKVISVPLVQLLDPQNQTTHQVTFRNQMTVKMPSFQVEGVNIWGGTGRMLVELVKVLSEIHLPK